jgi:predicted dehydrogenase
MEKQLKGVIIGAGGISEVHASAYEALANEADLVAVADVRMEKAEKLAARFGAKAFTDADEMLDKYTDLDFADVCVPTYLHDVISIKALSRKISVICEKPMAISPERAKRMADCAKENGVTLMTAHVIRFWPEYIYLKKVYEEKRFGELLTANFSRLGEFPRWSWENWFMDETKSGMAPVDLHIHDVDYIVSLLGRPSWVRSRYNNNKSISRITTQYGYGDKAVTAEGGWFDSCYPFRMEFTAAFEKAVVELRDNKFTVYHANGKKENPQLGAGIVTDSINLTSADGYHAEIEYFIKCLKNKTETTLCTAEDGVYSVSLVYEEMKSAREGREITV